MEFGIVNMFLAVGAGIASVLSPCVLPVVPVIVAGAEKKDPLRPLLVVLGLSLAFMTMGAISSLFGALLIGKTRFLELAGALVVMVMGVMVLFDISIFKRLYRFSNIPVNTGGRVGGLVLGLALGLVWIPCIGPFLSSVLTMVSTTGQVAKGIFFLALYSLGLAMPMLAVAYSSHLLQSRIRSIARHENALRYASGGVLMAFGLYSLLVGNFAF